jgi:hypothetical protein
MSGPDDKTFYLETFGCQMNAHDSEDSRTDGTFPPAVYVR